MANPTVENENNENNQLPTDEIHETNLNQESATDLDSIGSELTDSMPEIQQHAIDQEIENRGEEASQWANLKDKNGDPFDPKRHKTKKDGSPTISKTNKLMLKPSAPPKSSTPNSGPSTTQETGQLLEEKPELTDQEKQQCTALGKVSANMIFSVGRMLGGDEWAPSNKAGYNEAEALEQAFADYYISTGKTEISPAAGLCMAIGAYALPRFTMPKTKEKASGFTKKVFAWWHNRKGAKQEAARIKSEETRKEAEKKESTTYTMEA